ncbi:MAG: hypothetical protein J6Q55_04320, partial [Clostridia bacterium]|nr:hypothetical protein [Clostridia bacterium]
LSESSRKKLAELLEKYTQGVKQLRRRMINNGLIFSSVVNQANDDELANYNLQVSQTITHFDNVIDEVDVQLEKLESRYTQGLNSLDDELQLRIHERLQELIYREQKDAERITKYNTNLQEKETKYQASCERALQYAREAEYERAFKAAELYAKLGESGLAAQKISEKYNYCKQFFANWKGSEALLVVQSDSFLMAHLADYYTALLEWIGYTLPN